MSNVYNQGPRTLPTNGGADVDAYLLVDYRANGTVRPYVYGSGQILEGSTVAQSLEGNVPVQNCNAEGSRYLQLDNNETIAVAGIFTFGATAGTIAPLGVGEPALGYVRTAATSSATDRAIVEAVLFPAASLLALIPTLSSWPVGPAVYPT
jgi:hypothetical protein